jgi:hypothetical protein
LTGWKTTTGCNWKKTAKENLKEKSKNYSWSKAASEKRIPELSQRF